MLKKLIYHLLFSSFFTLFLIAPDVIYHYLNSQYTLVTNIKEIAGFFALSFFILMIRSPWVKLTIFIVLMLFSLSELAHYSYFGTLISPYSIPLIVSQAYDIGESFLALIGFIYAPFILIVLLCVPVVLAFLRFEQKLEGHSLHVKYVGIFLGLLLLFGPFRAYKDESSYLFQPKLDSYSVKNFYMALSLLVGKEIPQRLGLGKPLPVFAPYTVESMPQATRPHTVVVVMGESLGYPRMSLYGFGLPTTPRLSQMVANGDLFATKALSTGVQTDVSVPSFFTLKREPENTAQLFNTATNLFKLAKDQGYTTHYIAAQSSGILGGYIGKYADIIVTKEDFEKNNSGVIYDEVLLDYLKTVDLSKPNFIVLHQRNSHGPYDKYTPKAFQKFSYNEKDFHDFTIKTYANSITYTDFLLSEMINTLHRREPQSFLFFATSDHGELMGEEGRYGHAQLFFDVAKVPFLFAHKHADSALVQKIRSSREGITHYEIAKMVAESLGKRIVNPNENGAFYLNGVDINGRGGFITYRPDHLPSKL